jgi:hypothetical protein
MLKTDKGSISEAIRMARRAAGLAGVRYINGEAQIVGEQGKKIVQEATNQAEEEGFIDQAKQLFQSTANQARDAATQAQQLDSFLFLQPLRTTQADIPLPNVSSIEMPNLNPLSQEKIRSRRTVIR